MILTVISEPPTLLTDTHVTYSGYALSRLGLGLRAKIFGLGLALHLLASLMSLLTRKKLAAAVSKGSVLCSVSIIPLPFFCRHFAVVKFRCSVKIT